MRIAPFPAHGIHYCVRSAYSAYIYIQIMYPTRQSVHHSGLFRIFFFRIFFFVLISHFRSSFSMLFQTTQDVSSISIQSLSFMLADRLIFQRRRIIPRSLYIFILLISMRFQYCFDSHLGIYHGVNETPNIVGQHHITVSFPC